MSKKPDDAAKIAGLTSILKSTNKPKEVPPSPTPPPEPLVSEMPPPARRSKQGKVGKYRDPNYKHYGVYLRRDTHKRANRLWEDEQPDKDFSDLLQILLEQWLATK